MSTSLRQLTNRIDDLYLDNSNTTSPETATPPSLRQKVMGQRSNSPASSPLVGSSRIPSTPSPILNIGPSTSSLTTSPLFRLNTSFPSGEMSLKERDTSADDDAIAFHTHQGGYVNSIRTSRVSSYNPSQWRYSTYSTYSRFEVADKSSNNGVPRNPIEEHLYTRGYLNGVCSDISIHAFDRSYSLHRLILDRSPFFSSLFAGPWADADIPILNLDFSDPNITQQAFEIALQRLYGHFVIPSSEIVPSLLATGAYLDLQDLVEECLNILLRTLNVTNVAKRFAFARGKQYYGEASERLAEACFTLLCHAGRSMTLEQWDGISNEVAAAVVSSDAFWVEGEFERYCFTRDLILRRRRQQILQQQHLQKQPESPDLAEQQYAVVDDITVLEQVLVTGIHYLHLPFEILQQILKDTRDSKPMVPPSVIHHALWQQTNLRQIISSADPTSPTLNMAAEPDGWSVPSKDTMTDPFSSFNSEEDTELLAAMQEKVDSDATKTAVVGAIPTGVMYAANPGGSPVQESLDGDIVVTSSPFPPFRFSVEFTGIKALAEGEKCYSRTVFYAGSFWRLYVQKKRSKRPYLGFYLQRRDHKILPHLTRDTSLGRLIGAFNSDDLFSAAATGLEYESTVLYNSTVRTTGNRKSLYKHRQSASEPEEEMKRSSLAKLGLGYVDDRPKVLTYFKLWCSPGSAASSGVGMRQYNSKPDLFNLAQSWGWKSNTLCMDEKKESNHGVEEDENKDVIRFTVALGNV